MFEILSNIIISIITGGLSGFIGSFFLYKIERKDRKNDEAEMKIEIEKLKKEEKEKRKAKKEGKKNKRKTDRQRDIKKKRNKKIKTVKTRIKVEDLLNIRNDIFLKCILKNEKIKECKYQTNDRTLVSELEKLYNRTDKDSTFIKDFASYRSPPMIKCKFTEDFLNIIKETTNAYI